ncbi:MAG TPA: DUF222 domain-containing protein, partial [Mycobacteriales bacterium]|nr:DUF222 domain-containing protein [Mycobacteriales bacterium]
MSSRSDDRAAGRGDPDPVPADSVPVDPTPPGPVPAVPADPADPGPDQTGPVEPAGADGDGDGLVGEYWVDSVTGEVLVLDSVRDPETGWVLLPGTLAGLGAEPGGRGLSALLSMDPDGLSAGSLRELLVLLEGQFGWLESRRLAVIAALDRATGGGRCTAEDEVQAGCLGADPAAVRAAAGDRLADELRAGCALGRGEARRRVRAARLLGPGGVLPATGQALADGRISMAHAHGLVGVLGELPARAAGWAERAVLADPRAISPWQCRRAAGLLAARACPERAEQQAGAAAGRRSLRCWREGSGGGQLYAQLPDADWVMVDTALSALAGPFTAADGRPLDTRRADALVWLCAGWLDSGRLPADGGIRPHLSVQIPLASLTRGRWPAGWPPGHPPGIPPGVPPGSSTSTTRSSPRTSGRSVGAACGGADDHDGPEGDGEEWWPGPGWAPALLGGEPVDAATFARLACDCTLSRLVFEPVSGAVLDRGRESRLVGGRLRARLLARDR